MPEFGERYHAAFAHGRTLDQGGDAVSMSVVRVGTVSLPSGTVVACDPLVVGPRVPFVQAVLPGRYPVDLALARTAEFGECVAMARITFTSRHPAVWVTAVRRGEKPAELAAGATYGYTAESGTGAFVDGELAAGLDIAGAEDIDPLLTALTANYKPQRFWLEHPIDRRYTMVMFSSGMGEGTYASHFGIDEAGDLCVLVTDFGLLD